MTEHVKRDGIFFVTEYESAEQFLAALDMADKKWEIKPHSPTNREWRRLWMFRGQRQAEWGLKPSAWRSGQESPLMDHIRAYHNKDHSNTLDEYIEGLSRNLQTRLNLVPSEIQTRIRKIADQIFVELNLVRLFCSYANDMGISIGGGGYLAISRLHQRVLRSPERLLSHLNSSARRGPQWWERPAFALAQHHRVPTRLLDWSRQPEIAAFFAAEEAAEKIALTGSQNGEIAVYAISDVLFTDQSRFKLVYINKAENEFLRSQDGLFTFDTDADWTCLEDGAFPDFKESGRTLGHGKINTYKPLKYTLPYAEVPNLLRLLYLRHGISRVSIMPTLDSAASAAKLEASLYTASSD